MEEDPQKEAIVGAATGRQARNGESSDAVVYRVCTQIGLPRILPSERVMVDGGWARP